MISFLISYVYGQYFFISVDNWEYNSKWSKHLKINKIMEIKKLETREKWLCRVDGHSYVREVIHWNDGRPDSTHWWLNEDQIITTTYPSGEQLEEVFQKEKLW